MELKYDFNKLEKTAIADQEFGLSIIPVSSKKIPFGLYLLINVKK